MTGVTAATQNAHHDGGVIGNDRSTGEPENQHRESDEETPLLGNANGSSGFGSVNGDANGAAKNGDDEGDGTVKGKKLYAILCALWVRLGCFSASSSR